MLRWGGRAVVGVVVVVGEDGNSRGERLEKRKKNENAPLNVSKQQSPSFSRTCAGELSTYYYIAYKQLRQQHTVFVDLNTPFLLRIMSCAGVPFQGGGGNDQGPLPADQRVPPANEVLSPPNSVSDQRVPPANEVSPPNSVSDQRVRPANEVSPPNSVSDQRVHPTDSVSDSVFLPVTGTFTKLSGDIIEVSVKQFRDPRSGAHNPVSLDSWKRNLAPFLNIKPAFANDWVVIYEDDEVVLERIVSEEGERKGEGRRPLDFEKHEYYCGAKCIPETFSLRQVSIRFSSLPAVRG